MGYATAYAGEWVSSGHDRALLPDDSSHSIAHRLSLSNCPDNTAIEWQIATLSVTIGNPKEAKPC